MKGVRNERRENRQWETRILHVKLEVIPDREERELSVEEEEEEEEDDVWLCVDVTADSNGSWALLCVWEGPMTSSTDTNNETSEGYNKRMTEEREKESACEGEKEESNWEEVERMGTCTVWDPLRGDENWSKNKEDKRVSVLVCVLLCVCVRERERERWKRKRELHDEADDWVPTADTPNGDTYGITSSENSFSIHRHIFLPLSSLFFHTPPSIPSLSQLWTLTVKCIVESSRFL